jgi:hypothetical protein
MKSGSQLTAMERSLLSGYVFDRWDHYTYYYVKDFSTSGAVITILRRATNGITYQFYMKNFNALWVYPR